MGDIMNKQKLTKQEKAWILYDVGNSAFTMVSVSLFALFFGILTKNNNISTSLSNSLWSYSASIVTLIAVFVGPLIGTISDREGMKRPIFMLLSLLGILGCIALGIPMNYILWLIILILTKVLYNGALMIYDSMLVDITSKERMDKVSTYGYALGYVFSVIPFLIGIAIVALGFQNYNTTTPSMEASLACPWGYLICFAINAIWWLIFTIPVFKTYKQKNFIKKEGNLLKSSYKTLIETFKDAKKHKKIFLFLIAFFFYIDAVYSIIELAIKVSESLGVDQIQALIALIGVQFIAFPSSIIFAVLSKRIKTEKLIICCIIGYLGITTFACFINSNWMFWVLAICVGLFQGGIQSLSRSYFAKIIPENKSGEFFSLYDAFGKGASFLGTLLFGIINQATNNANLGIIPLVFLVLIGGIVFLISLKGKNKKVNANSDIVLETDLALTSEILEN